MLKKAPFSLMATLFAAMGWFTLPGQPVWAGEIGGNSIDWNRWDEVSGLPAGGYALGAAKLGSYAYAVGGDGAGQTNVVRMDGTTSVSVAGLPSAKTRLAVTVWAGTLYAIGGNAGGSTNVFAFNGTNWSEVVGLPSAREWLAAATAFNTVWAIGGSGRTNLYGYDGYGWFEMPGLPVGREKLAAATYSNTLYAIGGSGSTNVYAFDGGVWTEVAGLPAARQSLAATVFNGYLYAIGGENSGTKTNVYQFDGTSWTEAPGLPSGRNALAAVTLGDNMYAIGGADQTNIYRYPAGGTYSGVAPESGSYTGGYQVVITGTDLSDGTMLDVSSVTLCGVTATVDSVNGTTQIVVTAGAAGGTAVGTGDVRVTSISEGVSTKTNGFTYGGAPGMKVTGLNETVVENNAAASVVSGTFFLPPQPLGGAVTNTFLITNEGTNDLSISFYLFGGANREMFSYVTAISTVSAGSSSNLLLVYEPTNIGSHVATLSMPNNSATPGYVMNLQGLCYALSQASGPLGGGTSVTITNGHYGTVTNVTVGGVAASVTDSGATWVTIETPAAGSSGAKTIVIQTSENGDFTLASAFSYNPAGRINRIEYDWENWDEVSPLPHNGTFPSMVVYSNGLYFIGGVGYTNVYRFDGTNWTETAGLPQTVNAAAVGVVNGYVYLAGGMNQEGSSSTNHVFRFDGSSWTKVEDMPSGRGLAACGVIEDRLYVAFGLDMAGALPDTTYTFDGTTWAELQKSTAAAMPGVRLAGAVLGTNFYVSGGYYAGYLRYFQKLSDTNWSRPGDLALPRAYHASAAFNDKVYVIGGRESGGHKTNMVYSFNGTTWDAPNPPYLPKSVDCLAAAAYQGSMYVAGGSDATDTNVYRYPAQIGSQGVIPSSGVCNGGYEVTIIGSNLGNGSDITNVTLCGVAAASIVSQSATQVVITAGVSGSSVTGDVQVFSTSYGVSVLTNGFIYAGTGKDQQTITFAQIATQLTNSTVRLSATASSGLAVSFAVAEGPGRISGSTNLTFTGVGSVSVTASQAGNETYDPAPDVTRTFLVLGSKTFKLSAVALTNSAVVRWPDPYAAGISNRTVQLRTATNDYPDTTADGSLLYTGTNMVYEHTGLTTGETNYYTVFVSQDGISFTNTP